MNWQPIETAPKDQRVLLYYPGIESDYLEEKIVCGEYTSEAFRNTMISFWNNDSWFLWGARRIKSRQPTMWCALEPPTQENRNEVMEAA
jgi:hypothetical protein